jgi:hypothetical protein
MDQEPRYTTTEAAQRAALVARGLAAIAAGRPTGPTDAALERLRARACEREAAEATAREKVRLAEVQKRADAKAARRTASAWW